ncbi:hypothetical protein [Scytonema millei]|uniref:TIGR02588 family protein n=1 Tax=Scytonema millei VB511283 TaxID=1245923 RepID=A0A9X5E0B7_9CYAN|nr:hypothetical protein [Scytonema millei]NHC33206.1 hypothetical protein [Scytonema millei VB511283]
MKKLEKNWLEWIVFVISLILVLFTLGYIVYDGATLGETPPNIELQLDRPQPQGDRFIVPVTATNRGDETAETVQIEVTLNNDGKEAETAEFEIAFLPRHSTRRGWVTFQTDPRTVEQIEARVLGFEKP